MTQTPTTKPTGGVLQIPVAATQKGSSTTPPKKAPKPPAPRLKLLVRRLPPGLTQTEFETALGDEWKVGAGKVDWFQYKPGKVSKDPAKPSRPSRAYIHVVSSDYTIPLSAKVRQTSFVDARNTSNDPVLMGPALLEFAPYAKIPGSRVRKDARQGTIDQDPDFIAFLESLTQPITKPNPVETTGELEDKKETVTTTPLVQYIKEKKANKAKDGSGKSKHRGDKDGKSDKVQAKKLLQRADKDGGGGEKDKKSSKTDKATRDAVKAANKQAANVAKQASKSSTGQSSPKDAGQSTSSDRKRERGNVAAAAKILQRDLGIAPSGGRRRGGKGAASEADSGKNEPSGASSESGKKDKKGGGSSQNAKSKGTTTQTSDVASPRTETGSHLAGTTSTNKSSKSGKGKQASTPATSTATQAFLKHANPSQGVTEPLLEAAFTPFGQVVKVEIDKKKGFGYVDFAEPDGLQKAIAASPVSVAQSQVVVLERKINPGGEKSRGKGRGDGQSTNAGGNGNGNRGGKSGEGGSSRGPRGGRGSKNRGGSKPKENGTEMESK
ncbi:Smg-4/UPF3 family-domain-containing protein [Aspergillus ambiguus]|uniref:putative nonsense-mediated mRNA decay protein Upf3 n=1 Tax=Aspergillus ambiguus TaxID=176160 RepID=UPI003CCD24BF